MKHETWVQIVKIGLVPLLILEVVFFMFCVKVMGVAFIVFNWVKNDLEIDGGDYIPVKIDGQMRGTAWVYNKLSKMV